MTYPTQSYLTRPRTRGHYRNSRTGASRAATRIQRGWRRGRTTLPTRRRIVARRRSTRALGGRVPPEILALINSYL